MNKLLPEIFSDRLEIISAGGLSMIKNLDDFFVGYSKPISLELMRIFKDLVLVEHLGSGLNRILRAKKRVSYLIKQNYMKNVFHINTVPLSDDNLGATQETKKLSTKEKIIVALKKDGSLTREDLALVVAVSANMVKQHLGKLKAENRIKRIGSTKAGYWEVLNDQ